MKLAGKIFLIILGIVVILGVLVLLTVLSWWMQWPLFTGTVILLIVFALFFLYKAVRAYLRWQDKKKFVEQVALEQNLIDEKEKEATNSNLQESWNLGVSHMMQGKRYSRKSADRYPSFIVLDMNTESTRLFEPFGGSILSRPKSPLTWHFLPSTVFARFSVNYLNENDWEEVFNLMRGERNTLNPYGIILLFSYDSLNFASSVDLKSFGQKLRTLSQKFIHILEKELPVYILIEGMNSIPGMCQVLQEASSNLSFKMFGSELDTSKPGAAKDIIDKLSLELHYSVLNGALEGRVPKGDMIKAYSDFRNFGGILDIITEPVFRKTAYGTVPKSGGVYFCESVSADGTKGLFSESFLTETLSTVSKPTGIKGLTLTFYEKTKVKLMGAWLLLLFVFCSVISANTIYQYHVLNDEEHISGNISNSEEFNEIYNLMNQIKRLEKAKRIWPLPLFSCDVISLKELQLKEIYIKKVLSESVLPPILEEMRTSFSGTKDKKNRRSKKEAKIKFELGRELTWLLSVVSDKFQKGHVDASEQYTYPLTEVNEIRWNHALGNILLEAINWTEDKEYLHSISTNLVGILNICLTNSPKELWENLLAYGNLSSSNHEIRLSTFWSHIASGSSDDIFIPLTYTYNGNNRLFDIIDDLKTISNNDPTVQAFIENRLKLYYKEYEKVWLNFLNAFSSQTDKITESRYYVEIADSNNLNILPHIRFMRILGKELSPLRKMEKIPNWVNQFILSNIILEIALSSSSTSNLKEGQWYTVSSLFINSPELITKLRAETKDTHQLRLFLERSNQMKLFFQDVTNIISFYSNAEKCYALASKHFVTGDKDSIRADTDFSKMMDKVKESYKNYEQNNTVIAKRYMTSFVEFLAKGFTLQAAGYLQFEWEKDVLANSALMQTEIGSQVFSDEKGFLNDFISKKAKPFLSRTNNYFVPAKWDSIEFPFTQDFLRMLSQTKTFVENPTKAEYDVSLRSQPTIVNTDSSELPDSTVLKVMCSGTENELVNRNYPVDKKFKFKPEECGKTVLDVNFPSFTLEKEYDSFADFIEDFRLGERVFTSQEFEDSSQAMQAAQVKEVHVRILPDNTRDLLTSLKKQQPEIPNRITNTW